MSNYNKTVLIEINFISNANNPTFQSRGSSRGLFPLKGRRPTKIALEFLNALRRNNYRLQLERVTVEDEDITQEVQELDKIIEVDDNLPF